jgi:acetyltransferase
MPTESNRWSAPATRALRSVVAAASAAIRKLRSSLRGADASFASVGGSSVEIRPVEPGDREPLQQFVRSLAPESRRTRFFSPIRELPDAMLDTLTHPSPARESVLVAADDSAPRPRILALAQYTAASPGADCEVAVVVADAVQGQGLGARMMERLVEIARRAGFRRAVGDVLQGNRAMLTLARRTGFEVLRHPGDAQLARIVRRLDGHAGVA